MKKITQNSRTMNHIPEHDLSTHDPRNMRPTKKHARKVLELVDCGLVSGIGEPEPGKMCIEAAVCYALGLPHGDNPTCVGEAVRSAKIALNDSNWSSDKARAKGMRRIAIAQLGSDTIDQVKFATVLAELTIRKIVPITLRTAAKLHTVLEHQQKLNQAADRCEKEGTQDAASAASFASDAASFASDAASAASYASYARYAASDAASYAASAASYARYAASDAASDAASAASYASYTASDAASAASYASYTAGYAASAASYARYAASDAASDAASYARYARYAASDAASYAASDEILTVFANIIEEALVICKSPGVKWLDLAE